MRRLPTLILFLLAALLAVLASAPGRADAPEELDPGNMSKGDVGTLPKTTPKYEYVVCTVLGDDVLVAVQQLDGNVWRAGGGRFCLKDADAVAKYSKLPDKGGCLEAPILLPGVYEVFGTKTLPNGDAIPRLRKKAP